MARLVRRIALLCMLALVLTSSQAFAQTLTISPPAGTYTDVQGATVTGFAFTATGGTAPYTFTVSSGTFTPGNVLAANGTVTGTNTTAGSFTYTIRVTDALEATGTATYTDVITATVPTMPEWMLLLTIVGLAAVGIRALRNSRQTA